MACQIAFTAVLIAFSCSADLDADPWIGKEVFRKDGAKAKIGSKEIDFKLIPFPATVEDVDGEWLWLSRAWVRKSDVFLTEQALDFYTEQVRKHPSSADDRRRLGSVWSTRGDLENAINEFDEAIRLDPKLAAAYVGRGISRLHKNDLDNAIDDFAEAIRLDPK